MLHTLIVFIFLFNVFVCELLNTSFSHNHFGSCLQIYFMNVNNKDAEGINHVSKNDDSKR